MESVTLNKGATIALSSGGVANAVTIAGGATVTGPGILLGGITDQGTISGAQIQGASVVMSGGTDLAGQVWGQETVSQAASSRM